MTVGVHARKVNELRRNLLIDARVTFTTSRSRTKERLSSAAVPDTDMWMFVFDAGLLRHRPSGQFLLVITTNGGQYDQTHVYQIDPRRLRLVPLLEHGVLMGDTEHLANGILIEHTFAHYVGWSDTHDHKPVHRVWRYRPKLHTFRAEHPVLD